MPLGTLGSNIAGCFVIGVVAQITAGTELVSPATTPVSGHRFLRRIHHPVVIDL